MAEEERWRDDNLLQQVADVAVGNAWGGECPLRPYTFTCEETSAYLCCSHFHTFRLPSLHPAALLVFPLSPRPPSVLSAFCRLSSSLALCPAMPCFVRIKKTTEDTFSPHDLVRLSQWACSLCPTLFSSAVLISSSLFHSWQFVFEHTHTHIDNHSLLLLVPAPPPPSFPPSVLVLLGAVALTHSHWQITFLMEFNYLSLPCGDLARKRPTAGARGRTGREGKRVEGRGRERRSFPPVARNWITSVLIWRDVIHREKEGERGILGGSQRKGERCLSDTHTGKKKRKERMTTCTGSLVPDIETYFCHQGEHCIDSHSVPGDLNVTTTYVTPILIRTCPKKRVLTLKISGSPYGNPLFVPRLEVSLCNVTVQLDFCVSKMWAHAHRHTHAHARIHKPLQVAAANMSVRQPVCAFLSVPHHSLSHTALRLFSCISFFFLLVSSLTAFLSFLTSSLFLPLPPSFFLSLSLSLSHWGS